MFWWSRQRNNTSFKCKLKKVVWLKVLSWSLQNFHEDVYHLSKFKYPFALQECLSLNGAHNSNMKTQTHQRKNLTGGNWQKWKRVFLTCPCHEIYRDEAVGLKSCKNTWKITIFVKMWNLGQYRENLIFCQ